MKIQNQNFGVEIELTGITRQNAAKLIAQYYGTSAAYAGTHYDTYTATDCKGRTWKAMSDSSIVATSKINGHEVLADNSYKCEIVTPILQYEDIKDLQEISFGFSACVPIRTTFCSGEKSEGLNYHRSRITPAEAALMLDVPNMLMVNCDGTPVPFSEEAYGYAESFCRMNKVLWGATGSGGFRVGNEEQFICKLAENYPNIGGAFMDDFMCRFKGQPDAEQKAEELLKEIRAGLDKAPRPMELYIVWYTYEMEALNKNLMNYIDGLTLWTWKCEELPQLEQRFEAIEKNFPNQKKLLGIYMYDFPSAMPVPNDLMEHQCELGLRLMKEGRLDGMIFETNSVMGVGLPSEKWLRGWLETAKYTEIPD